MAHTARSQYRNSQYGRPSSATEPTPNLIMSSTAPRVLWVTTASCYDKNCMSKPEWAADLLSTTNSPRQRLRQRFDRYWKVACWSHTVESLTFSAGLSSLLRGGTVATDQLTRRPVSPTNPIWRMGLLFLSAQVTSPSITEAVQTRLLFSRARHLSTPVIHHRSDNI